MTDPDIADQDTLLDPDEKDIEAPDADALEQAQVVDLDDDY